MKVTLLALVVIAISAGCATAAPVVVDMTLPEWNSLPGSCSPIVGDTLRDLSQAYVYAQRQGAADSILLVTLNVAGLENRPLSVTVDRPEGSWSFWVTLSDATGNRSCRSNVATTSVVLAPAPAVVR